MLPAWDVSPTERLSLLEKLFHLLGYTALLCPADPTLQHTGTVCYMSDLLVQYTVRPCKHNLYYNAPDLHIRFTSVFTFSVQPFKSQIFGATRTVFSLYINCGKVFSLSDKKDAHAVEQCRSISLLNVNRFVPEFTWPSLLCMLLMMALAFFGLLNCTLHVGCGQHSAQNG